MFIWEFLKGISLFLGLSKKSKKWKELKSYCSSLWQKFIFNFFFFFPSLDLEIDWDSPPIYDKEILDDLMSQSFIVYKNVSIVQESLELKGWNWQLSSLNTLGIFCFWFCFCFFFFFFVFENEYIEDFDT